METHSHYKLKRLIKSINRVETNTTNRNEIYNFRKSFHKRFGVQRLLKRSQQIQKKNHFIDGVEQKKNYIKWRDKR